MLPIPEQPLEWTGLSAWPVTRKADDTALNRLVVTSGDFGLAYLTERWAARFVSNCSQLCGLLRGGYSINDGAALHDGCAGCRPNAR